METITLNGLKWDWENLVIKGKRYSQFNEAQEAVQALGKRLPTEKEFQALLELGSAWDHMRHGRWFGLDAEKLGKSDHSIFFPAWGYENYDIEAQKLNGSLKNVFECGYLYSSEPDGFWWFRNDHWALERTPIAQCETLDRGYEHCGFSIRCVSDIE